MRRVLYYFFKYTLKYKWIFFLGLFFTILERVLVNFTNFFPKFFIESLQNNFDKDNLIKILIIYIVVKIAVDLLGVLTQITNDIVAVRVLRNMRNDVFKYLHDLDFYFHANKQTGGLISVVKRGYDSFFGFHDEFKVRVVQIFIDFIFISSTFFILNYKLGLVIVLVVLLNLLSMRFLIMHNIKKRKELNKEDDNISSIFVDNLINYETVKYFAKEEREQDKMIKKNWDWTRAIWRYANSFRLIDLSTSILSAIGIFLILYISVKDVSEGEMSLANLILVIGFTGSFFPRLTDMIFRFREIAKRTTDLNNFFGIFENTLEVIEKENPVVMDNVKGNIEFKDIVFGYKDRNPIFNKLNLNIEDGESVALVGQSGGGKTTVTKLLLRFYDVSEGAILIDGINIKDLSKKSLRSNVGIVPQEAILFNDTIGYNISYGKDNATQDEIESAAKLANLYDFIESLPEKYETVVGERGIKLSGGQKQRLAIARVFITNPPIIVFDEATSQLDSESEKLIQDAFWKLAKGKTVIIIAHRLSTILKSDRIIVLKDGEIKEQGKHQELIELKGEYAKLWNLQKGGVIE